MRGYLHYFNCHNQQKQQQLALSRWSLSSSIINTQQRVNLRFWEGDEDGSILDHVVLSEFGRVVVLPRGRFFATPGKVVRHM